jgi:hypothetical protein
MIIFVYAASPDSSNSMSYVTEYSIFWIPLSMFLFTLFTLDRKQTSSSTWHQITWLQYTSLFALINAPFDSSLSFFQSKLIFGLTGSQLLSSPSPTSMPSAFSLLGFTNYYFLSTCESWLLLFFASLFCCLLLVLLSPCSAKLSAVREKHWTNLLLRAALICCYSFFLFGLLQVYHLDLSTTYSVASSVLAVGLLVLCTVMVVYLPVYTAGQTQADQPHPSTLLCEFTLDGRFKSHYYFLFMLTRLVSAIFLVFFDSMPFGQVVVLGLCCIADIAYLAVFRPFAANRANYYAIGADSWQVLILVCLAVYLYSPVSTAETFLHWSVYVCFWAGVLTNVARFVDAIVSAPRTPPVISAEPVPEPNKHARSVSAARSDAPLDDSAAVLEPAPQNDSQAVRETPPPPPPVEPSGAGREANTSQSQYFEPVSSGISYYSTFVKKYIKVVKDA